MARLMPSVKRIEIVVLALTLLLTALFFSHKLPVQIQIYTQLFNPGSKRHVMIIEPIEIILTTGNVQKRLRLKDAETADSLIAKATPLIDAKAAYSVSYIDERSDGSVVIDQVKFTSGVLHKNLSEVNRVFAFVLTLGAIFEEKIDCCEDLLEKYYLEEIGNLALRKARLLFERHLRKKYGLDKVSCMSPGSLPDWPVDQQKDLFDLLGDTEAALGVRLTDSMLMLPRKSVSGIYFPSEVSFFSCQLCPRDRCDGRKAPYDASLAKEYGVLDEGGGTSNPS